MGFDKGKRTSLRVGIKKLTSIIKIGTQYEVVEGDHKTIIKDIKVMDMSTGGLCIHSNEPIEIDVSFDLEIFKTENLGANIIRCISIRSDFNEDPLYNKSYYEIGIRFEKPNTDYLKNLFKLAIEKKL
jgi:hypothetical protein